MNNLFKLYFINLILRRIGKFFRLHLFFLLPELWVVHNYLNNKAVCNKSGDLFYIVGI